MAEAQQGRPQRVPVLERAMGWMLGSVVVARGPRLQKTRTRES